MDATAVKFEWLVECEEDADVVDNRVVKFTITTQAMSATFLAQALNYERDYEEFQRLTNATEANVHFDDGNDVELFIVLKEGLVTFATEKFGGDRMSPLSSKCRIRARTAVLGLFFVSRSRMLRSVAQTIRAFLTAGSKTSAKGDKSHTGGKPGAPIVGSISASFDDRLLFFCNQRGCCNAFGDFVSCTFRVHNVRKDNCGGHVEK